MKAYSINAIETLKGALKSVCENMPHSSDSKWLPPRTHDCSLGASKQARLHRVTRNVPRAIIAPLGRGGSYSPRRHWCTSKPVYWEPGSEACVQIIGDVRSIAAIPFASLLSRSHLGPPRLDTQHYSCVDERPVPCESEHVTPALLAQVTAATIRLP